MELFHHGIKGQKWGVRRYQNADGSLTAEGQKRYERDVRENNAKKKDNRAIIDGPDPKRWAAEDLDRSKQVVDAHADLVKELKKLEQTTAPKSTPTRLDLSKMSDKELRDQINRELLEQQYNKLFGSTGLQRAGSFTGHSRCGRKSSGYYRFGAEYCPSHQETEGLGGS